MNEDENLCGLAEDMKSLLRCIRKCLERSESDTIFLSALRETGILRKVDDTCQGCAEFIASFCDQNFGGSFWYIANAIVYSP